MQAGGDNQRLINIHILQQHGKFLATNATVEGQTTAYYINDRLEGCNVNISRLAHGIPMGGELDYLDDGTLGAAFKARLPVA